jgi:hypothetical protein
MHLFAGTPSISDFLQGIVPLPITAILIGAGLALYLRNVKPRAESDAGRSTVVFLVAWAFLLPVP